VKNELRKRRLVNFLMDDAEPLLYHNELVWCDESIVGYISPGMIEHALGRSVGIGYLKNERGVSAEWLSNHSFEIEVVGVRYPARASLKPFYDPNNERMRM
jgi:glycine cleavage system aminomethyltransferase T